eukprot:459854-Rhodomonas_salina.2
MPVRVPGPGYPGTRVPGYRCQMPGLTADYTCGIPYPGTRCYRVPVPGYPGTVGAAYPGYPDTQYSGWERKGFLAARIVVILGTCSSAAGKSERRPVRYPGYPARGRSENSFPVPGYPGPGTR